MAHTCDMAVRTVRMAPRDQRAVWPGAENLLATARAAQVKQPDDNNKDCGVCAPMSAIGTLLRVPRQDNLLSTLDRQWVAAVALNRDMGPIARLPSPRELLAAMLYAVSLPRTPLEVADIPHHVGLPEARMRHALLCMAAVEGGMSMVMMVSLQHVKAAMQEQRLYGPLPWEENARRWLHLESVPPTHTVGEADTGKLVVLEGAEYWVCIRASKGDLEWVVVPASRLRRQQSRGPACYRVLGECLRSLGPVCRAYRCRTGDVPQAPAVFLEVTQPPRVPGQDVWPVAPSNMWQAEHAAAMCRACRVRRQPSPRRPRRSRPATGAARVQSRGEHSPARPADLEALHLGAASGDEGTALNLQGTMVGSAAVRFCRHSGGGEHGAGGPRVLHVQVEG